MTRSRVVQGAISAFYRSSGSTATSTSYCSSSISSRSSSRSDGAAGIKHIRCISSVSMAMPSSQTTPSSPLDRVPSRAFRFHSFTSTSALAMYHFSSRNEIAKLGTEKSFGARSDRGFSSSSPAPTSSTSSTSTGAEEENANHHLDEAAFHAAADETLHDLVDALESWVDCEVEGDEADVEYSVRHFLISLCVCFFLPTITLSFLHFFPSFTLSLSFSAHPFFVSGR